MSFDTVEQSVQGALPVELYSFVAPVQAWYVTTYHKDIAFGGQIYTATTGSRSNLMTAGLGDDATDVTIELPASHSFPQTYANAGIPPRDVLVTVTRYYPTPNVFLQFWQGYMSGLSFRRGNDGPTASVRVPAGTADQLQMDFPAVGCRRICNNILYDAQCTIARAGFQSVTTIAAISTDGKAITVAATLPAAVNGVPWARHGEILHATSTERRTVIEQLSSTQVQIQGPFPVGALHVGDSVTVFAGCDHRFSTCNSKFANTVNFQGYQHLPTGNIFYVGLVNAGGS